MTTSPLPRSEQSVVLETLLTEAGITTNRALVHRILETGIQLGQDDTSRLDLKIASSALAEMRDAFRLFRPFADVPKITVFGSARTRQEDPEYRQARDIASVLAGKGWMVVTGAGPGIMQAAAEGAGPERSLGVSISLPFEEKPNEQIQQGANNVAMKYFFTRKLMLVKESRGFVCVPGGFGTLDEMFELLTLQQTGKAEPVPIVLLDAPGGTFWSGLKKFVTEEMAPAGVISPDDFERVLITDSVAEAEAEITGFWRNFDSLRWVDDELVLRLRHAPQDAELDALNDRFSFLLSSGSIVRTQALPAERADNDRVELPRLRLRLSRREVGRLHQLIRALNALSSAVSSVLPPA